MMKNKRILPLLIALLLGACPIVWGNTDAPVPSVKVVEAITQISASIEGERYEEAVIKGFELLKQTKPGTIDAALTNLVIAQAYSLSERFPEAVPHLEAALSAKVLDENATERYTLGLVHLYEETNNRAKSVQLLDSFLAEKSFPGKDILYLHAIILLQEERAEEALKSAQRVLRAVVHPPKEYYQLAAACAQETGNYELACGYLERMIEMEPHSELLWTQLMATYLAGGKLHAALVSLERAQKQGLMTKPENNVTRVELYYNLERYKEAAEVLEQGLADGSLPNEQRLWEMLAYSYDLLFLPEKATAALERASTAGAWSGIDMRLAERNWQAGKFEQTIANLRSAWDKGGVDRPGDLWLLMASAALELEDLDTAEEALSKAAEYPESAARVQRLQRYIEQIKQQNLIKAEDTAAIQS